MYQPPQLQTRRPARSPRYQKDYPVVPDLLRNVHSRPLRAVVVSNGCHPRLRRCRLETSPTVAMMRPGPTKCSGAQTPPPSERNRAPNRPPTRMSCGPANQAAVSVSEGAPITQQVPASCLDHVTPVVMKKTAVATNRVHVRRAYPTNTQKCVLKTRSHIGPRAAVETNDVPVEPHRNEFAWRYLGRIIDVWRDRAAAVHRNEAELSQVLMLGVHCELQYRLPTSYA
jgi:hypothetical protein